MSQITRCPSCATMFKVVADQLRISDGWVRCGHCKQVFDASAYLQAPAPQALMPEMALDQIRPPPQPVPRAEPPVRSWGMVPVPPLTPPSATEPAAVDRGVAPDAAPVPQVSRQDANVLPVPDPGVPAFLAVHVGGLPADATVLPSLALVSEPAFAWRTPAPVPNFDFPPRMDASVPEPGAGIEWPTIDFPSIPAPAPEPMPVPAVAPAPAGYELPSPVLEDADLSDFSESGTEEVPPPALPVPETEQPEAPSPQELAESVSGLASDAGPCEPESPFQALAEGPEALSLRQELRAWQQRQEGETPEGVETPQESREVPEPDAVDFSTHAEGADEVVVPAGDVLQHGDSAEAEPGAELLAGELSFVRAARRKAFWRKPAVRASLSLVGLLLLGALSLQVVVHERRYLAAALPQTRAHLESLCAVLECKVGPYRHIASVVVDASSFQKIKGDDYQLSLTLRNHAETAVEMPAVELTLTDALDQPVLRRVLRPEELTAPAELLAQAEWSTAVPVQIAPGSARITGYRVLAFYP